MQGVALIIITATFKNKHGDHLTVLAESDYKILFKKNQLRKKQIWDGGEGGENPELFHTRIKLKPTSSLWEGDCELSTRSTLELTFDISTISTASFEESFTTFADESRFESHDSVSFDSIAASESKSDRRRKESDLLEFIRLFASRFTFSADVLFALVDG